MRQRGRPKTGEFLEVECYQCGKKFQRRKCQMKKHNFCCRRPCFYKYIADIISEVGKKALKKWWIMKRKIEKHFGYGIGRMSLKLMGLQFSNFINTFYQDLLRELDPPKFVPVFESSPPAFESDYSQLKQDFLGFAIHVKEVFEQEINEHIECPNCGSGYIRIKGEMVYCGTCGTEFGR